MKVWYHTDDPTTVINFDKFLASYEGEFSFDAPDNDDKAIDHYDITWDGETPTLVRKDQSVIDTIEQDKADEQTKTSEGFNIRAQFEEDVLVPVDVTVTEGTFTFNGGERSSVSIKSAIDLCTELGETTVGIWDIDNVVRQFSYDSANTIAATIGKAYRDLAFEKQAALVALEQ